MVLVGFMGAGKTTVGRLLAQRLGWDFCDLDRRVEVRTGQSVAELFASRGEAAFREEERAAALGLLEREACVVAAGGGAWHEPATREVLADITDRPSQLVLNKVDKVADLSDLRAEFPDGWFLSAKNPADVADLRLRIVEFFERDMVEEEVFIPYAESRRIGVIRSRFRVVGERNDEHGSYLTVRGHSSDLAQVR